MHYQKIHFFASPSQFVERHHANTGQWVGRGVSDIVHPLAGPIPSFNEGESSTLAQIDGEGKAVMYIFGYGSLMYPSRGMDYKYAFFILAGRYDLR